jgi:hypothetical protein
MDQSIVKAVQVHRPKAVFQGCAANDEAPSDAH